MGEKIDQQKAYVERRTGRAKIIAAALLRSGIKPQKYKDYVLVSGVAIVEYRATYINQVLPSAPLEAGKLYVVHKSELSHIAARDLAVRLWDAKRHKRNFKH